MPKPSRRIEDMSRLLICFAFVGGFVWTGNVPDAKPMDLVCFVVYFAGALLAYIVLDFIVFCVTDGYGIRDRIAWHFGLRRTWRPPAI